MKAKQSCLLELLGKTASETGTDEALLYLFLSYFQLSDLYFHLVFKITAFIFLINTEDRSPPAADHRCPQDTASLRSHVGTFHVPGGGESESPRTLLSCPQTHKKMSYDSLCKGVKINQLQVAYCKKHNSFKIYMKKRREVSKDLKYLL